MFFNSKSTDAFIREVELGATQYIASKSIDLKCLQNSEFRTRLFGECLDKMILELRTTVYGRHEDKKQYFQFPLNWWEAFKLRFFSAKLLKRFPVKYETIYVTLSESYPDFKPAMPDRNPVIRIAAFSDHSTPIQEHQLY